MMWCIGENLPYDSLRDGTAPSGRSGPCSPAAGVSQASGSTCNYMRQPPETSLGVQRFFFIYGRRKPHADRSAHAQRGAH